MYHWVGRRYLVNVSAEVTLGQPRCSLERRNEERLDEVEWCGTETVQSAMVLAEHCGPLTRHMSQVRGLRMTSVKLETNAGSTHSSRWCCAQRMPDTRQWHFPQRPNKRTQTVQ